MKMAAVKAWKALRWHLLVFVGQSLQAAKDFKHDNYYVIVHIICEHPTLGKYTIRGLHSQTVARILMQACSMYLAIKLTELNET